MAQELMARAGPFRTLIEDYGSASAMHKQQDQGEEADIKDEKMAPLAARKDGQALILQEDREVGSVAFQTYLFWIGNMGWWGFAVILFVAYIISSGTRLANTLWVGWWQQNRFGNLSQAGYQGIYAGMCGC